MNKVLMVVLDGLGDRTYAELNNCSPLEFANTPNLDLLATNSICGMLYPLGIAIRPSSDVAHMALFGLDYEKHYTGRGPIEISGLGISLNARDLAFRGNFAVVNNELLVDRRTNRQSPPKELLDRLKFIKIDGCVFELYHIAEHRFALRVVGDDLSSSITDSDPHIEGTKPIIVVPTDENEKSKKSATLINKYIKHISELLCDSTYLSNCILLRGGGELPSWYNFYDRYNMKAACITNNALYNGIGHLLGMEVLLPIRHQNYLHYYSAIPEMVMRALTDYEFVFLHLQEADLFGEDGDVDGKVSVIEKIDNALGFLNHLADNILLAVTSDHSTPCCLKAHSGDSVPVLFHGEGVRTDDVNQYNERCCAKGGLGTIQGENFMPLIYNFLGRAELKGC